MTERAPQATNPPCWDLSDLFAGADDPLWPEALARCLVDALSFQSRYRGRIAVLGGPAAEDLRGALNEYAELLDRSSRAQAFARLVYAAETTNDQNRALFARADSFATELRNHLLFFDLEWLQVSEGDADRLMADPALEKYVSYLRRERLFLPHKLNEEEEKIANEKDLTGRRAWTQLFAEVTGSLSFVVDDDGTPSTVTLAEVLARFQHPRRDVRKNAHDVLYATLDGHSQVLTFVYDTLIQDHLTMDRLRKFPDPMRERHLTNNIPPEAVEQMMIVVEEGYGLAQDYFRAKASMLGIDRLTIYDQYAPIGVPLHPTTFEEARTIILDAFSAFHPRFETLGAEFFDRRWIDAEIRPGKRNGAFCAYPSPKVHPYIMANYTGNRRDVMTIAHELGHGIHGQLARGQHLFDFHAPLPLAETASVFAEMLVFDRVLAREDSPEARRALTAGMVESVFATVFRQTVLTRFEQSIYQARGEGRLNADQISGHWIAANAPYYGDALEMSHGYRLGWSYIPHFINSRFYCYAYTFGELLVLALYALYRERGAEFIPDYIALLERGGAMPPADALRLLGVDITDPSFWRKGMAEIQRLTAAVAHVR